MKISNISFPYPVLGINDDIEPMLPQDAVVVSKQEVNSRYVLEVTLKCNNQDIESLIENGYAVYSCEVDCASTLFRECYTSKSPNLHIEFDRDQVSGKVNIQCFVSVVRPIKDYKNSGFNSDYEGATFDMSEGDILVGFPEAFFNAELSYNKLVNPTSIIQIREDKENPYTNYDFSSDKIEIKLPTPLFDLYNNRIWDTYAEVIHASLAYNALTCALFQIGDYMHTRWAQAIQMRIQTEDQLREFDIDWDADNVSLDRVPELATKLMNDPYNRMLNKLTELNSKNTLDYDE
jgi:hypothetical protein